MFDSGKWKRRCLLIPGDVQDGLEEGLETPSSPYFCQAGPSLQSREKGGKIDSVHRPIFRTTS